MIFLGKSNYLDVEKKNVTRDREDIMPRSGRRSRPSLNFIVLAKSQ